MTSSDTSPALFARESAAHVAPFELYPGALAVSGRRVIVGTLSGWAIYDLPNLALLASNARVLEDEGGISGVQWDGEDALLLAQHRALPKELLVLSQAHTVTLAHVLPSGDWQLVKHAPGPHVFLYDVGEASGIVCHDREGQCWHTPMPDVRRVVAAGEHLLCLGRERLLVLARDGSITATITTPGACAWTTATAGPDGELWLGGYDKVTHAFAVTRLDRRGTGEIHQHPLASVFAAKTIRAAFADADCGIDLFHVGRMYVTAPDTLLVALGGGGDELGASQGAAALGIVHLGERVTWRTHVVSTEDGISGFAALGEGRWLVDLCGEMRVYAS